MPAIFPGRGETEQLFWGLIVCFISFGFYMMYAPFIEDSDDQFSQLAQIQIFMTLLSSIALRTTPPSEFVSILVTVMLFFVPILAMVLETDLVSWLTWLRDSVMEHCGGRMPRMKPPSLKPISDPNSGDSDAAGGDSEPAAKGDSKKSKRLLFGSEPVQPHTDTPVLPLTADESQEELQGNVQRTAVEDA